MNVIGSKFRISKVDIQINRAHNSREVRTRIDNGEYQIKTHHPIALYSSALNGRDIKLGSPV